MPKWKKPVVTFPVKIPIVRGLDALEDGRPKFRLEESFLFVVNEKHIYKIPAGFEFDFNSVPRGLWNTFPPYHPESAGASLIHDWCYAGHLFPRLYADDLYKASLKFTCASRFRRRLMVFAVKSFGWVTWRKRDLSDLMVVRALSDILETKDPLWEPLD